MNEFRRNPSFYLLALGLYLTCVFVLSHFSSFVLAGLDIKVWDKAAHFIEYVPVGFLLYAWIGQKVRRAGPGVTVLLVALAAIVLVGLDEFHQSFVPGRNSDLLDGVADLMGTTLGVFAGFVVFRERRRKQS